MTQDVADYIRYDNNHRLHTTPTVDQHNLLLALPIGIGFILISFDKKKQGWYDKLAKSFVIHK